MSITLDLSRVSNAPAVKAPVNLSGLTRAGLRQALIDANVCPPEKAKMRASQVWSWIHHYGVTEFSAMSNVAKDMQAKLAEHFTLARRRIRMLGLEDDRALRRHPEQGRIRVTHPHPPRPRHPGRLRPAEVRKREDQSLGAPEGRAGGGVTTRR